VRRRTAFDALGLAPLATARVGHRPRAHRDADGPRGSIMKRTIGTLVVLFLGTLTSNASATNGMNPVASGVEAAGRGGVDQAIATETTAMNTNPAGITQSPGRIDATVSLLQPSLTLTDRAAMPSGTMTLDDGVKSRTKLFPLINAGFTTHIWNGLYGGLGFATQGGMGAEFRGLHTFAADPTKPGVPTPSTYDTFSQVAYMKLTPTLAYRFEGLAKGFDLSFGAALNLGMSSMEFRHSGMQFPEPGNTSGLYAQHSLAFKSDWATGVAVRLGVLAEMFEKKLSVGLSYQSKASLKYKGAATVDGQLSYDGNMDFGWPQEIAGGVAVRPIPGLVLGADLHWIGWSAAIDTVTLSGTATGPAPAGYGTLTAPFQMHWRDQLAFAVGGEYEIIPSFAVRAGYNYGKSPVRSDGVNPLFPAVSEHHFAFGVGVRPIPKKLSFDFAMEVSPANTVSTDANNQLAHQPGTTNPNGYSVDVSMSQVTAHIGASYRF
jgi:long-chain fatty acid transport protein